MIRQNGYVTVIYDDVESKRTKLDKKQQNQEDDIVHGYNETAQPSVHETKNK